MARVWDETVLALIRQVVPAPGVHARNLFHVSAAMWDAWAAYDSTASGYVVTEKHRAGDATAAREAAISYAAYRILLWRYATVADLAPAREQLDAVMASLCYRTDYTSTEGDDPAALGNRIAEAVLTLGKSDGALEEQRYADLTFQPVNEPLEVAEPGTTMVDPDRWQPLSLAKQIAQNGLPIPGKVQTFIGHQWGHVTPFALPATADGVPIDPGPPPTLADPATADELKTPGRRRHPEVVLPRRDRRRDDRRRPGRRRQQHARHERRRGPRGQPGHRASRTRQMSSCGGTTRARSPSSGPTGRTPRRRPATGTCSPTRSAMRRASSTGSPGQGPCSTGSNGT